MILRSLFSLLMLGGICAYGQLNVQLVSNLDYEPILNDIWGYVDEDSTEYAIVGMTTGTSIVSLADPAKPQEVLFIDGVSSIWRDIKTWGDYAFVTADQGQEGLLVIDLSPLPQDTPVHKFWRPEIPGIGFYNRSHNIWIDEFGFAYLAGSNTGGVTIIDVATDPWNPEFVVNMPLNYAHDIYVRNNLAYTSEIYLGQLRSYDVTNKDSIQLLGSITTPYAFTHNAWLSDDGNYCFTTDERSNAFIGSYDVSDPTNIIELDRFRPAATEGLNVIPHNVHVFNDFGIISYYTDGCIIFDGSRPDNLVEVGNFDTYLDGHGGYSGAWGAYPFLPSGLVLISDRQYGLFVLAPNYVRACFLEGDVKNSVTGLPVVNATVEIVLPQDDTSEVILPTSSNLSGVFKTGKAVPGTFTIRISHPDYFTQEIVGEFENGEVLELHVLLVPRPTHGVVGRVFDASSLPVVVPGAYVVLESEDRFYQTQADAEGQYSFGAVIEDTYKLYAGNWGMYLITTIEVNGPITEDLYLQPGYYDDFVNDLGWTVSGTSMGAHWERGEPIEELLFDQFECNPNEDVMDDIGDRAYVTGNNGGDAEEDDVEGGFTLLSSPNMDLSGYNEPVVSYRPWICERLIEEQVYFVLVSNGFDTVAIDTITTFELGGYWHPAVQIALEPIIELTNQMQLHFLAEDRGADNVVKAGLDVFNAYDANPSSVRDLQELLGDVQIYPNPTSGKMTIELVTDNKVADHLIFINAFGQKAFDTTVQGRMATIDVSSLLPGGLYVVQLSYEGSVVGLGKVVIQ